MSVLRPQKRIRQFSVLRFLFSVLIVMSVFLLPLAARSQSFEPFKNSFVSMGIGPSYYSGSIGADVEVAFGKWILNTTSLRGQFEYSLLADNEQASHSIYYGHVDLCIDLFSAIRGRNPSNRLRSYLLLGGGVVHSSKGDNDFCASVGLGGECVISDNLRLYTEVGSFVHPSDFDNNEKSSFLATLNVGIVYDIAGNPTRSRSLFETKTFADDWSFNIALGVCSVNYSEISSFSQRTSLITPVFEFGLGKRLTTFWQIRLCASGLYAKTDYELFSFYNVRGDVMIDPVSYFSSSATHSSFSVIPYLGVGVVARLDNQSHFLVAPAAGAQLVWRADKRNQLYVDARYLVTPPRFVNTTVTQRIGAVGLATLMLGYSHTFSKGMMR